MRQVLGRVPERDKMAMTAPTGTVMFARWLDTRLLYIEVRDAAEYFEHIQDVKITKDMIDLAKHIVEPKSGHFEPAKFQITTSQPCKDCWWSSKGTIAASKKAPPSNVYNLMDALRASIKCGERTPAEKPAKAAKKPRSAKPAVKRKAGWRRICQDGLGLKDDRRLLELRAAGADLQFSHRYLKICKLSQSPNSIWQDERPLQRRLVGAPSIGLGT